MRTSAGRAAPPLLDRGCGERQWTDTSVRGRWGRSGGGDGAGFKVDRKAGRGLESVSKQCSSESKRLGECRPPEGGATPAEETKREGPGECGRA